MTILNGDRQDAARGWGLACTNLDTPRSKLRGTATAGEENRGTAYTTDHAEHMSVKPKRFPEFQCNLSRLISRVGKL